MSSLEELRQRSPALGAGLLGPLPDAGWLAWLSGLMADELARRVGRGVPVAVGSAPVPDVAAAEDARLAQEFAPLADLGWLRALEAARFDALAAYEEAVRDAEAVRLRVESGRSAYAAEVRAAVSAGKPGPEPFDSFRADVELRVARERVGATAVELAERAEVTLRMIRGRRPELRRLAWAPDVCAMRATAMWREVHDHPFLERVPILDLLVDVEENYELPIHRFSAEAQRMAGGRVLLPASLSPGLLPKSCPAWLADAAKAHEVAALELAVAVDALAAVESGPDHRAERRLASIGVLRLLDGTAWTARAVCSLLGDGDLRGEKLAERREQAGRPELAAARRALMVGHGVDAELAGVRRRVAGVVDGAA